MQNKVGSVLSSCFLLLGSSAVLLACAGSSSSRRAAIAAAKLIPGTTLITGASTVKGSVNVTTRALSYSGIGMVRFNDGWGASEYLIDLGTFDQNADFGGENGSLTLTAQATDYPNDGGAYAVLTSFSVVTTAGPTIEYVNLSAACAAQGMWDCSSSSCTPHAACAPTPGQSAFATRTDWDQHQVPPYGYVTTNTFPHCDSSISGWSNCPVKMSRLPSGHYYAKYLMLSDSGDSVAGQTTGLAVNLLVKKDTQGRDATATNGGINLNVILVGDKNISDSHTAAGARNLNLLFGEVNRLFSLATGAKIFLNQIKTYEWTDANNAAPYSQIYYDQLGNLFEAGSKGVDAVDNGKNINIFIVSDIEISGTNFTILGLSGAILGPPLNGTQTSGLAFASFDQLATFNPACTTLTCGRDHEDSNFLEMGETITHELGHYLGLNHPSEKALDDGTQAHDALNDTPTCFARSTPGSSPPYVLDHRACYLLDSAFQPTPLSGTSCATACNAVTGGGTTYQNSYLTGSATGRSIDPWVGSSADMPGVFCPAVKECQFNHVMWYTTKNRRLQKISDGSDCSSTDVANGLCNWVEDGNMFGPESAAIIQWDPLVF